MYTITNLQINPDILADYSLLPVKENSTGGDSGAYAQDIYRKSHGMEVRFCSA